MGGGTNPNPPEMPPEDAKPGKKSPQMPKNRRFSEKRLDRKTGWDILRRQNNARRVP